MTSRRFSPQRGEAFQTKTVSIHITERLEAWLEIIRRTISKGRKGRVSVMPEVTTAMYPAITKNSQKYKNFHQQVENQYTEFGQ